MSGKITKKELKEPDFLQIEASKFLMYFEHHRSKVLGFLVALLVVMAIFGGWSLYRFNYNKSALKLYNQVESANPADDGEEASAKLLVGYQSVTAKYPQSKAGLYAYYQLGNQYFELHQYDKSLQSYGEFLQKADSNNFLRFFAYTGQGYCYEAKKDYTKSLGAFEEALKVPEGKELAGQIYSDLARIYEKLNDIKKSKEYYRKAIEKTRDRSMEDILRRKLVALN
ncbi:MAG: tetratricopeptide repeat protein [Syntrophales bacterium]